MSLVLSPPKIVLLAVELAAKADIDGLRHLAARHDTILRKDILLRILLTYLPEALPSSKYVGFLEEIERGEYSESDYGDIDSSAVEGLSDQEATKKVRKLHLLQLSSPDTPPEAAEDSTTQFLLRRAYKVDEEAGLLDSLPDLLVPFLDHSPCVRTLMVSAILPLLRRNFEYYPASPIPHTLYSFQRLPDRTAVSLLLDQTGEGAEDHTSIARDLRGLIGPWLYNEKRWTTRTNESGIEGASSDHTSIVIEQELCPGWAEVLEWLTTKASKSWRVAVSAIEEWDGPDDVDLGGYGAMWLNDQEQEHLERTYARAALASAYLIPEASQEALSGAHSIVTKIMGLLDQDQGPPLQSAASLLPPISAQEISHLLSAKNATWLRNDLLQESNPLTTPTKAATQLLYGLTLSAYLLTRNGVPCTVRRAGELALLQDERDQKSEAAKLTHTLSSSGPKSDDKYWTKARKDILWLRDWGSEEGTSSGQQLKGVFGQLKREYLEVEILKALLANTRYSLARSLYEDSPDKPLSEKVLQDTVFAAAYNAFDNASNPNRARGGLKKCDDIIKAFPKTIEKSLPATKRIEALLKATHALSEFRIVLKQGEPFTPVLLRVHQDPIAIVGKILEQNPKSYTRVHDLVDLGANMVAAGLTTRSSRGANPPPPNPEQERAERETAERRITAMCIDAALTEDDFETAYSYVTNRLSALSPPPAPSHSKSASPTSIPTGAGPAAAAADDYSWKAALQAGKYRRTPRTLRPTHLGTASANPEIRHLEQRIDCLSTALRIAPAPTLTEILNAFRRAEEELVAALAAEAEQESAWDERADQGLGGGAAAIMPGGFGGAAAAPPASAAAKTRRDSIHQVEEKPMSLFDLSRASVASAQRNLTALSSLQRSGLGRLTGFASGGEAGGALSATSGSEDECGESKRVRKRDQLREAAMGSLVSGVGWLIGADNNAAAQGGHEER
ncbi:secretory pathway Sec39 [Coniochaeta ligniaria NRRL 30616]|uniref:Secretory pathway Sec39 n=1 Tax=Coniochaeta ligniaria NRRL 30616 TaxID=1408157 RepID=A0A1J7JKY5_9PEZI|nr:secretory pathway Sec39 [Coniochaeta ligniaria NRRL 30616]